MADKIYVSGLRTFPKRDNAPDFVLGTLIITPEDIVQWCKDNPQYLTEYEGKKQVKLQLTRSDKGKVNMAVDTWKPEGAKEPKSNYSVPASEEEDPSDLPF